MLGAAYAGVLQRDGWAPYRQFVHAAHQTAIAPRGAQTQPILASVLRTVRQRGLDTTAVLVTALHAPTPVVLDAFQHTTH